MSSNENFLKAYRDFETAVKTSGFESVLAYENALEEKEKKTGKKDESLSRIRLCRQCRNYLSHESKSFFEASDDMVLFLKDLTEKLDNAYTTIKKHMVKQLFTEDSKLQEVAMVLGKKKDGKPAPVFNKAGDLVGYISSNSICIYVGKNNVNSTTKVKVAMETKNVKSLFKVVSDTTTMKDLDDNKSYLVKNSKGIVIGWK